MKISMQHSENMIIIYAMYNKKKGKIMKKIRIVCIVIALLIVIFMLTSCGSGGWGEPQSQNEPLSAFNTSCLPLTVADGESCGNFVFDANGNLLFHVDDKDEIRSLNRSTCTVTTVATDVSFNAIGSLENEFRGMTYYDGSIFIGGYSGNIYKTDQATGNSTLLTTIPSSDPINGLVVAPATYSPYGGQLIVATYSGHIYAVDQSVATPTPVHIAYIGTSASALIFDSAGTLYLADYFHHKILTLTATGTVTDFATGLDYPDGLAFGSNVLYVSNDSEDSVNGTIKSVTIPGGVVSDITPAIFNYGWAPSPIIYDATSNILLMGLYSSSGGLIIDYYGL